MDVSKKEISLWVGNGQISPLILNVCFELRITTLVITAVSQSVTQSVIQSVTQSYFVTSFSFQLKTIEKHFYSQLEDFQPCSNILREGKLS